jgi:chemotaxis protein CheD
MKKTIDVNTGELAVAGDDTLLRSTAIGSCIVIIACDRNTRTGALAHVMLPGRAPRNETEKTKYAVDAITLMLERLKDRSVDTRKLVVCLVGAGNVLERDDDTICRDNAASVRSFLAERSIRVCASVLGGTTRKAVTLDVETGNLYCSQGAAEETVLWRF